MGLNLGKVLTAVNPITAISTVAGLNAVKDDPEHNPYPAGTPQALMAQGAQQGRAKAEEYYGQSPTETGIDVQDVIRRRREMLDQKGPASTALLQSANRNIMQDRAVRASQGRRNDEREQQLARGGAVGAAQSDYNTYLQNLGLFQGTVGNVLSGQAGLEQGYAALAAGQAVPAPQKPSGGLLGGSTVICTELWRQGIMPLEVYYADWEYGVKVRKERPEVYIGYRLWADHVVKLMRKSSIFTRIVAIPAMAWANHMAGKGSFVGSLIARIGEPICGLIGKIYIKRNAKLEKVHGNV